MYFGILTTHVEKAESEHVCTPFPLLLHLVDAGLSKREKNSRILNIICHVYTQETIGLDEADHT